MEQLLLSEFLLACSAFEKDATEENEKNIKNFLNKLVVKTYMSYTDKEIAMMNVLTTIPAEYDAVASASQYCISKLIYGLLPYASNLTNDLSIGIINFFVIDCLYRHGLVDNLLQYCADDYHRWENMVDMSIRFDGIYKMLNTMALIDGAEFDKWIEAVKAIKTEIDPETIKTLAMLASEGSGSADKLKESLAAAALEQAEKQARDTEANASRLEEVLSAKHVQNDTEEDKKDA